MFYDLFVLPFPYHVKKHVDESTLQTNCVHIYRKMLKQSQIGRQKCLCSSTQPRVSHSIV